MSKSRSFAITINTRVGITEQFQREFEKWLNRQDYGSYVTEKCGADKHIHAQIWLDEGRTLGNVAKPLKKMIERNYLSEDYIMKHCLCTKAAWNDKFQEYCNKENPWIIDRRPDDTEPYYPTPEEQAKFMEIAKIRKNWCLWEELEKLWNESEALDFDDVTIATFLSDMMFDKRVIRVEPDQRKRINMMRTFKAYMMKSHDPKHFLPKDKIVLLDQIAQLDEALS